MIDVLTLNNFRNHEHLRVHTHGKKNIIITGPNGSGKTAILEAVSMLGGDRGMRAAQMMDIARFGGSGGFGAFAKLSDDTQISISFNAGDSNRRALIDGDNANLSEMSAHLRIIWLTPKEDRLFVDSAADRRAFFDRLVASFESKHTGRVARLSKLLSERAFALKCGADNNWLMVIEKQISGIAVAVAAARIRYAGEINFFLENAAISVAGQIELMLLNGTAADAEQLYFNYLADNRELIGDKMIVDGAHKSDFGVFNKVLNLPVSITSTGQQKAILIDLILSHAKLIREKTGNVPLVLLDEAVAHLDARARHRMFEELAAADAQVWATGLDADIFADVGDAVFVACADGVINNILIPTE